MHFMGVEGPDIFMCVYYIKSIMVTFNVLMVN